MYSSCIYLLTNNLSGEQYIGFTGDYEERMDYYKNPRDNRHIANSIRKNGWNNFSSVIIYESIGRAKEDYEYCMNVIEPILIDEYDTYNNGYNMTIGGGQVMKGRKHTDEAKKKMSIALSGENHPMYGVRGEEHYNFGKKLTEEHKLKIGVSSLGHTLSQEAKDTISKKNSGSNNGMYGKKGPNTGKTFSQEVRDKISKSKKGVKLKLTDEQRKTRGWASFNPMKKYDVPPKIEMINMFDWFTNKQVAGYYGVSVGTVKIWKTKQNLTKRLKDNK